MGGSLSSRRWSTDDVPEQSELRKQSKINKNAPTDLFKMHRSWSLLGQKVYSSVTEFINARAWVLLLVLEKKLIAELKAQPQGSWTPAKAAREGYRAG